MTKIFVTMTALVLAAGSAVAELPQSVNGPASSGLVQLATTGNPAGLQAELARNLMRNTGFEGVMRFRCSKGCAKDQRPLEPQDRPSTSQPAPRHSAAHQRRADGGPSPRLLRVGTACASTST